jgi:hypothetical protein
LPKQAIRAADITVAIDIHRPAAHIAMRVFRSHAPCLCLYPDRAVADQRAAGADAFRRDSFDLFPYTEFTLAHPPLAAIWAFLIRPVIQITPPCVSNALPFAD